MVQNNDSNHIGHNVRKPDCCMQSDLTVTLLFGKYILIFQLASVAEQIGFSLTESEIIKTGFLVKRSIFARICHAYTPKQI